MRYVVALPLIALLLLAASCGGQDPHGVPNVTGQRLDIAVDRLEDEGLEYELLGGGTFGVVVKSNWYVCEQQPAGGSRASSVDLIVGRSCPVVSPPTARPPVVPALEYMTLEEAREEASAAGVAVAVHNEGAGPVLVESNWTVCSQYPEPGERAWTVDLYVEHFCDD
jgi:beta-lactam-binding protein with PASTA domain